MQEELDELVTERHLRIQNMPESGQPIFPQDSKCKFELSKLKLTMHWPLLCREQCVRKMGWVIKLQNHRNRENGQAVFEEVTGPKQFLLILVSFFPSV